MKRASRGTLLTACALLAVIGSGIWKPAAAASSACHASFVPVSLAEGLSRDQYVYVKLCMPKGKAPRLVQLLVHGATYAHNYWDFPDPTAGTNRYSYVVAATNAGYATLAMDRIGIGQSSHPLSVLVDLNSNAHVVHEVIQALRNGRIPGPKGTRPAFSKVIAVGHSLGTAALWLEATRHHDADGVVLTGFTHKQNADGAPRVGGSMYPSNLDPKFSLLGYDPGYLTTRPGTRYQLFYAPAQADPAVVAVDEQTKETATDGEFATFGAAVATPLDITVPVLLVMGQIDGLFCSPEKGGANCSSAEGLVRDEGPYLGPRVPSIEGYVLEDAGHDINLMLNAPEFFTAAQEWIRARFGS